MPETLGERIHRMQVEDRNLSFYEIDEKVGHFSVYRYAGWALTEIERLRAENAKLRESGAMLIKTVDRLREEDDAA